MCRTHTTKGFTLTEILVVVAVLAILATVLVVAFQNINDRSTLRVSVQETAGALLSARNRTLASEGETVFGVHINETEVVEFLGMTYSSTSPTNRVYTFSGNVTATSSLSNGSTELIFERLTGYTSATGTITFTGSTGGASSTIRIHRSGTIEVE